MVVLLRKAFIRDVYLVDQSNKEMPIECISSLILSIVSFELRNFRIYN
jgi:hypothetical protein